MSKLPSNYYEQLEKFSQEHKFCSSEDFEKGKYLYLFMVDFDGVTKCFGVGYTVGYALKKGMSNITGSIRTDIKVSRPRINKVRVGETKKMGTIELDNLIVYNKDVEGFAFYIKLHTEQDKHGIHRIKYTESFKNHFPEIFKQNLNS